MNKMTYCDLSAVGDQEFKDVTHFNFKVLEFILVGRPRLKHVITQVTMWANVSGRSQSGAYN